MFNEDWTTKYFFVEHKQKAVCVICSENDVLLLSVSYIAPDISPLREGKE